MAHDPLSPSEVLRTPAGIALAAVSLLVLAYSLVIVGQVLLGVIVGFALPAGLYLSYRLFAALDSIADGAQRIAAVEEREAADRDEASRSGGAAERGRETERSAERDR